MAVSAVLVSLTIVTGSLLLWPGVFSAAQSVQAVVSWRSGNNVPNFLDCCNCDYAPKTVTLQMVNVLKPPHLDMKLEVKDTYRVYLIDIMQQAANISKDWRFSSTYYNEFLGYSVDSYNNVYANYSADKSYWRILDGAMTPTPVGISNYIPKDRETVTFNLTIHTPS